MLDQENNQSNSLKQNDDQSSINSGWSQNQIRGLKWTVIIMSVILVLGFGLVIYKMTDILISNIARPEAKKVVNLKESEIPVTRFKLEGRKVNNISLSGSKLAIELEKAGNYEIWIYNRSSKTISEKIILKNNR